MDTPMSHSEFEELAAGYVLGALEPDDEHDFQRHLSGCATCEANVRELEAVVGKLAYATPPVDPPDTLWAGIRREIQPGRPPRRGPGGSPPGDDAGRGPQVPRVPEPRRGAARACCRACRGPL